jgi:hypothetical protein
MNYRSRIYQQYSSAVQGVVRAPSLAEMDRWGEPYDSYLRGWLPSDLAAPIVDVACGYGLDIVEHFGKDELLGFLDACHRALRPEGALIIQTPNADSPWGLGVRYGDYTHEVCLNPQVLKAVLSVCGFREFEAREQGPVARGPLSLLRAFLWQGYRVSATFRNLVETGSTGSRVFTRVFVARSLRA